MTIPATYPTITETVPQGREWVWTPEGGKTEEYSYSGTTDDVASLAEQIAATWEVNGRTISQMRGSELSGRGRLLLTVAPITNQVSGGSESNGDVEELYAVDVIRDTQNAPMFESMDAFDMATVVKAVEDGEEEDPFWAGQDARMPLLYRMLLHKEDAYFETAFVYRQSFYKATSQEVGISFTDINSVVATPPTLSGRMLKLIEQLPVGEWLYKPPQMAYVGKGVYHLTREWMWAVKWSVMYGGTLDYGATGPYPP